MAGSETLNSRTENWKPPLSNQAALWLGAAIGFNFPALQLYLHPTHNGHHRMISICALMD
jgi:hypothetical protein